MKLVNQKPRKMKGFSRLFHRLEQTTKTNDKLAALKDYFGEASDQDKTWAIALLAGKRPKRTIKSSELFQWAVEESGLPLWLFEESYHVVGDFSETISLVIGSEQSKNEKSLSQWMETILGLKELDEVDKEKIVKEAWRNLSKEEVFVFNKLIYGISRIGVSRKLMVKALSQHTGQDENVLEHRLMGDWDPRKISYEDLVLKSNPSDQAAKPYPFYLAYPLEDQPDQLGDPIDWQFERKWDGIRGQIIRRSDHFSIWSRGEELMTDKFPELHDLEQLLPQGTVLDGEIMAYHNGALDFNVLQTRIGRKNLSKAVLEKAPIAFISYDLMELDGNDVRQQSMEWRRTRLEQIVKTTNHPKLLLSEIVEADSWSKLAKERERSRELRCEGLMLKRKLSPYQVGRKRGDWWKWKIDPYSIDAVLIYAMRGHGRRANLYTDYTFAVWNESGELVPFAKAYSGLKDDEFREVDRFVKRNTIERFGPVRSVSPELVFELHFEGIAESKRHKSGIALRFPRMHRWRKDKKPVEANTLKDLQLLLINR